MFLYMSNDCSQMEKDKIAQDILAYLAEHPHAQDTFRGIVEWWLMDCKIKYQVELVRDALAVLVEKQFLVEHRERVEELDSYRYEVNSARQEEIKALLGH